MIETLSFARVWAVDFEFAAPPGDSPSQFVVWHANSELEFFTDVEPESGATAMPLSNGADDLIVAYLASAEIGCHLALGWPVPERILDLYAEFRWLRSGLVSSAGFSSLGAMSHFGLDSMSAGEKEAMRELVLRGGPYSADEVEAILDYCQEDVDGVASLLRKMLPILDIPRAMLRGRYMSAVARVERTGVPIDTETLDRLVADWDTFRGRLIDRVDSSYGVYEGTTFKRGLFTNWLASWSLPWPRLFTGELDLKDETFRQMARAHPEVAALHELRATLSRLKLNELAVGPDGRNRALLGVFQARTGRNQPST